MMRWYSWKRRWFVRLFRWSCPGMMEMRREFKRADKLIRRALQQAEPR